MYRANRHNRESRALMTRYSFIRVTRSFVFPSLFNHFLGCSPTALNAQNQKMLGNKETHVYARDTRIQIDAKIQRRTDVGTTSVAYLNLVIQICSTFFYYLLSSLSLVSLSFPYFLLSFFFFFLYMHMHIIHFIFSFIFPASPFYFAGSCHRREILTTLSSRHNSFSPLPSP